MTEKEYDQIIRKHYQQVAKKDGLSATSTMADTITREKETQATVDYLAHFIANWRVDCTPIILDVGCGNGYTLEILTNYFPDVRFQGIEKSDDLRLLAESRFKGNEGVTILAGDIRDPNFFGGETVDGLICQRVLINLLESEDQKKALENLVRSVKKGGMLLFFEAFDAALGNLNTARMEFDIPAMEPAHHNLYLAEGFFNHSGLEPYPSVPELAPANFLSTHYFVTRVLHPIFLQDRPFKRNSEFVKFFTQALKENIGDYAPLKLLAFTRV